MEASGTQRVVSEGIVLGGCAGGAAGRAGWAGRGCGRALRRGSLARQSSPRTHDRTTDARARCRITALKIPRERDRLFGNGRAACFEPVIDSVE